MKINSREKLFCNSGCPLYLLIIEIKKNSFFVQIFFFSSFEMSNQTHVVVWNKKRELMYFMIRQQKFLLK